MAPSPPDPTNPHPHPHTYTYNNRSHSSASLASPIATPHPSHTGSPAPLQHPLLNRSQSQSQHPPTTTTTTESPLPSPAPKPTNWHFPGPSSKYHTRSYSRPDLQQRTSSATTTVPIAPSFATDRRAAHRRSYTAATNTVPTTEGPDGRARERKDRDRDKDRRSPLTRFGAPEATATTATMARDQGRRTPTLPSTPASKTGLGLLGLGGGAGAGKRVQDSPFSDYFTDDGRSPGLGSQTEEEQEEEVMGGGVQKLLLRLNEIGAVVLRAGEQGERGVGEVVERKVRELEAELGKQGRWRGGEDSGLFMDEEEEGRQNGMKSPFYAGAADDGVGLLSSSPTKATEESDRLLAAARDVLSRVEVANGSLRCRHDELRVLHERHATEMEDREQVIESLKAENEGLRSDVGFGRSELLFLKLQLEALEVETSGDGSGRRGGCGLSGEGKLQLERGFQYLRDDWKEVEARFRARSGDARAAARHDGRDGNGAQQGSEAGEWTIDVQRERTGRVERVSAVRLLESRHYDVADGCVGAAETFETPARDTAATPEAASAGVESPSRSASGTRDSGCQTHASLSRANSSLNLEDQKLSPQVSGGDSGGETASSGSGSYANAAAQTDTAARPVASDTADGVDDLEAKETPVDGTENQTPGLEEPEIEEPEEDATGHAIVSPLPSEDAEAAEADAVVPVASATKVIARVPPRRVAVVLEPEAEERQVARSEGKTRKTAWQELWEGLGQLAGMGETEGASSEDGN